MGKFPGSLTENASIRELKSFLGRPPVTFTFGSQWSLAFWNVVKIPWSKEEAVTTLLALSCLSSLYWSIRGALCLSHCWAKFTSRCALASTTLCNKNSYPRFMLQIRWLGIDHYTTFSWNAKAKLRQEEMSVPFTRFYITGKRSNRLKR